MGVWLKFDPKSTFHAIKHLCISRYQLNGCRSGASIVNVSPNSRGLSSKSWFLDLPGVLEARALPILRQPPWARALAASTYRPGYPAGGAQYSAFRAPYRALVGGNVCKR